MGFTSFNLMVAHVVLITLGYAATTPAGLWGTIVDFVLNYPGMLLAVAGTVALCAVVVTSMRAARRRLRYESWHLIHLYAYLGVGLALPHQLWTGQEFLTSPLATVYWWTLYAAALGSVLVWRVGLPVYRSLRHGLVVTEVRRENERVTTVTVGGRDLHRLPVRAGQFLHWRFLSGSGSSRAHPYSLSAAPDGRSLRITVAHLGDDSSALSRLRPGTRVMVEGPYGRLHAGVRTRRKVLLMASGIGITPMRALLEDLEQQPGDVVLIYRARSEEDVILREELVALAESRGARLFIATGSRVPGPGELAACRRRAPQRRRRTAAPGAGCGHAGGLPLRQRRVDEGGRARCARRRRPAGPRAPRALRLLTCPCHSRSPPHPARP